MKRYFVQMKSFSDIGKENHRSLETYFMAHSRYLRDGGENFPVNTASLSPAHSGASGGWVSQTSLCTLPTIRNLLWAGDTTTRVLQDATVAQLPGLQLLRQVWRIGEDSKQLHVAGS